MSRIFLSLALFAILLLSTTMVLGLRIGDYNGPYEHLLEVQKSLGALHEENAAEPEVLAAQNEIDQLFLELEPLRARASLHKLISILAAIVTVLVNSIAVTYFIGTSRWCKEVATAYTLENSYPERSNRIKRRSFPWSFLGIMTTLGIIALGAASDPATLRANTSQWVQPHLWSALGGIALISTSFLLQMVKIQEHSALVEEILAKVREIRLERGLEVE